MCTNSPLADAPDAIMRRIYHFLSPRSVTALRQVNQAWHAAATPGVIYDAVVQDDPDVAPIDELDPRDLERGFRRQHRFETLFAARVATLQKPVDIGHRFSFTQDKDILVGIEVGSHLIRWDLTDQTHSILHSGANRYVWGRDRSQLVYAEEFGSVFVLEAMNTAEEQVFNADFYARDIRLGLDFDPAQQVVAAGSWAGTCAAHALNGPLGTVPLADLGHEVSSFFVKVVHQGQAVVHTGPQCDLYVTRLDAPAQGRLLPDLLQSARLRPARALGLADLAVAQGGLWRVNFGADPIACEPLLPTTLQLLDMRWIDQARRIVTIGGDNTCRLYSLHEGMPQLVWKKKSAHALVRLYTAEQGHLFAYGDAAGTLHVHAALASECPSLGRLQGLEFTHLTSVDFSEDGEHVMVDREGQPAVIKRLVPASVPQRLSAAASLA